MVKLICSQEISSLCSAVNHIKGGKAFKYFEYRNNGEELIDEISTMSLFNDEPMLIIVSPSFFNVDSESEALPSFLTSTSKGDLELCAKIASSERDIVILCCQKNKTSLNSEAAKIKTEVISKFSNTMKDKIVSDWIKNNSIVISSPTKDLLLSSLPNDALVIENELEKLFLLKFDNKKIDECDVQDSIVASEESNHFRLVEFLLKKERANSIKLYNNLLLKKYDIPSLVSIVSSQLFSLKLLKLAMARGMRGFEIETELGMSSYQQKVNSLLIRDIPAERIDELLANFYLLDYNIKHNLINSNLGMKALLIQ